MTTYANLLQIFDAVWAYPTRTEATGTPSAPTTWSEAIAEAVWEYSDRTAVVPTIHHETMSGGARAGGTATSASHCHIPATDRGLQSAGSAVVSVSSVPPLPLDTHLLIRPLIDAHLLIKPAIDVALKIVPA